MSVECLTWIPHLLCSLFGACSTSCPPLPDDVLINILSRLPAESVLQCRKVCKHWRRLTSSPYFVKLQDIRAPVVILLQHYELWKDDPKLHLSVLDENTRRLKIIRLKPDISRRKFNLHLVTSYGCLVVFEIRNPIPSGSIAIVLNLITQEQRVIYPAGIVCGLYYDPSSGEYKLLQRRRDENLYQHYYIYSLASQVTRKIAGSPSRFYPVLQSSSIVNHTLHWIVNYVSTVINGIDLCMHAIMVFKMDSEDLFTMPHPTSIQCRHPRNHELMHLFVMDNQLCFSNLLEWNGNMDIWILEDYANWYWVKRYNIALNFERCVWSRVESQYRYQYEKMSHWGLEMNVISVRKDELLVDLFGCGLYLYHLTQKTTKKINVLSDARRKYFDYYTCAGTYVSTIATSSFIPPHSK